MFDRSRRIGGVGFRSDGNRDEEQDAGGETECSNAPHGCQLFQRKDTGASVNCVGVPKMEGEAGAEDVNGRNRKSRPLAGRRAGSADK
jgi:hypothetical protein